MLHSYVFFLDWDQHADDAVAMLRTAAGRDPYDEGLCPDTAKFTDDQRRPPQSDHT
jgi:hypothetical protein